MEVIEEMNEKNTNLAIKILGGWYILTHLALLIPLWYAIQTLEVLEALFFAPTFLLTLSALLILVGFAGAVLYIKHKRLGWQILTFFESLALVNLLAFYAFGGLNPVLSEYPTAILAAIIGAVVGFGFTGLKLWILWVTRVAFEKK